MAKVNKQLSNALLPWALPVLLVVVWQIASQAGWLSTRILPSPENIVITFWHLAASGELWQHLAISGWRAAIGFAIGGSIGLILGLITGTSRTGERLLDTSVQMLRNVPHLALIPLVISVVRHRRVSQNFSCGARHAVPYLPQYLSRHTEY